MKIYVNLFDIIDAGLAFVFILGVFIFSVIVAKKKTKKKKNGVR
jgi:hypothetical protein